MTNYHLIDLRNNAENTIPKNAYNASNKIIKRINSARLDIDVIDESRTLSASIENNKLYIVKNEYDNVLTVNLTNFVLAQETIQTLILNSEIDISYKSHCNIINALCDALNIDLKIIFADAFNIYASNKALTKIVRIDNTLDNSTIQGLINSVMFLGSDLLGNSEPVAEPSEPVAEPSEPIAEPSEPIAIPDYKSYEFNNDLLTIEYNLLLIKLDEILNVIFTRKDYLTKADLLLTALKANDINSAFNAIIYNYNNSAIMRRIIINISYTLDSRLNNIKQFIIDNGDNLK